MDIFGYEFLLKHCLATIIPKAYYMCHLNKAND